MDGVSIHAQRGSFRDSILYMHWYTLEITEQSKQWTSTVQHARKQLMTLLRVRFLRILHRLSGEG